jgi:hypothetical protein
LGLSWLVRFVLSSVGSKGRAIVQIGEDNPEQGGELGQIDRAPSPITE